MSGSDGIMNHCHKARFANSLMGVLKDSEESYGEWAFWCCNPTGGHGWAAKPCDHTPEDQMLEWIPPWKK